MSTKLDYSPDGQSSMWSDTNVRAGRSQNVMNFSIFIKFSMMRTRLDQMHEVMWTHVWTRKSQVPNWARGHVCANEQFGLFSLVVAFGVWRQPDKYDVRRWTMNVTWVSFAIYYSQSLLCPILLRFCQKRTKSTSIFNSSRINQFTRISSPIAVAKHWLNSMSMVIHSSFINRQCESENVQK